LPSEHWLVRLGMTSFFLFFYAGASGGLFLICRAIGVPPSSNAWMALWVAPLFISAALTVVGRLLPSRRKNLSRNQLLGLLVFAAIFVSAMAWCVIVWSKYLSGVG
jgi:hypothetical protein